MKRKNPLLLGVLLLAACGEKEQPAETAAARPERPNRSTANPLPADDSAKAAGDRPTKVAERPPAEKKPPIAEPAPGKPGMVLSPYNGKPVDVRGIPAGKLVMDPHFPAAEKKFFRVPEGIPHPAGEEGDVGETQPESGNRIFDHTLDDNTVVLAIEARPVPGKQGLIFNPFDNTIIDVSGLEPGSVVIDPNSQPDSPRYIGIPGGPEPTVIETPDP